MTTPKTLPELANIDNAPGRLADSVLIVLDAQLEHVTGTLPLEGVESALANIARLLEASRAAGTPRIHVIQTGKPGRPFDPAGAGFGFADPASPAHAESICKRALPSAFTGNTMMKERIFATGRKSVILAGFMTHLSVAATARAALELDYRVTVLSDATATRALPDLTGGPPIPAADVQRAVLAALADQYAIIATTSEVL